MWLSAMADVRVSASNDYTAADNQSNQGKEIPAGTSEQLAEEFGSSRGKLRSGRDEAADECGSSGCDVTVTDNDSGAVDDVELTYSDDVAMPTGPAPDGGYGWVVVVASFFNAFIIDGIGSCYGLIFPHVMEKFGTSASVASLAGSLFNALMIMGSISALLVKKFGYRVVAITGGVLACCSVVISALSTNVILFILSYGLFSGCACGLVFLPSIVIVNGYFHERRGLANGIITSGSGAGLLVLAQLVNYLLEEFSLEGTLLVLAGVLLNMCVFSSVYQPPGSTLKTKSRRSSLQELQSSKLRAGSSDSGHLSSASLCPSVETVSTVGKDLDVSDTEETVDGNKETLLHESCHHDETPEKEETDEGVNKENVNFHESKINRYESHTLYPTDEASSKMDKGAGNRKPEANDAREDEDTVSKERSPLAEIILNEMETNAPAAKVDAPDRKHGGRITVSPYPEVESRREVGSNLLHSKACHRSSGARNDTHQFWRSAYNLPTTLAPSKPGAMHSSAYDVSAWSSTNTKRIRTSDGLVPLGERSAFHRTHHYHPQLIHKESINNKSDFWHQRQIKRQLSQDESNQMHHSHPHHHHDHQLSHHHKGHQFDSHRRLHQHHHTHHSSHLSELEQGSNFYLTGSISTLRNLQFKHILHLATSHDASQFPAAESHISRTSLSQRSKSHLSHLSESRSNILNPPPLSSKSNLSRGSKSHLSHQSVALLPATEADSSLRHISNQDIRESFLPFSSKQSLHPSTGVPYQPINLLRKRESSLHVSQWSLDLEGAHVVDAIALGCSSTSLALPTVGYSLKQLLRMPCFYLFCIGSCLIQIGYPIPSIFLADLAYHQGLNASQTTVLMSVMGGLNIAGRLLSGLLANMGVKPLKLLYTSLFLGGMACLLAPFYTTFWSLMLFAALFGFFLGAFPPVQPLVIVEYFGLDSLASVFGLLTTIKGASSMLGPPLAGWVYDASGQYPMSFVFGGGVFILSAATHIVMPWFRPK
ncbi:monocarboxylate transporter [Plakobranchus ocellatus]|uniref:Monocarboxylate transporter n=1 Tax=Plakobranchus ocellatus TaxID=259542 RepID=A0AAV4AZP9_9GAST|nr:monocarboxylate transporter [Plakobranchus ocellatus]